MSGLHVDFPSPDFLKTEVVEEIVPEYQHAAVILPGGSIRIHALVCGGAKAEREYGPCPRRVRRAQPLGDPFDHEFWIGANVIGERLEEREVRRRCGGDWCQGRGSRGGRGGSAGRKPACKHWSSEFGRTGGVRANYMAFPLRRGEVTGNKDVMVRCRGEMPGAPVIGGGGSVMGKDAMRQHGA